MQTGLLTELLAVAGGTKNGLKNSLQPGLLGKIEQSWSMMSGDGEYVATIFGLKLPSIMLEMEHLRKNTKPSTIRRKQIPSSRTKDSPTRN